MPTATLRALLAGLIDYAGLFPPASLELPEAVANFASYRRGDHAWALGRFVLPAARLDELARSTEDSTGGPWRLSAVIGADASADSRRIQSWNARYRDRFIVDVAEVKAGDVRMIAHVAGALAGIETVYVEVPVVEDPRALLDAVRAGGARAKIRTGGTTADAIPSAARVARFISCCAELALPFKATAGLHHPLRGEFALTYADGAPRAEMFGFLHVFLAAALARSGASLETLAALLGERDGTALRVTEQAISWREHRVTSGEIDDVRASFACSFGSCSFREPIDDLHQLGLL